MTISCVVWLVVWLVRISCPIVALCSLYVFGMAVRKNLSHLAHINAALFLVNVYLIYFEWFIIKLP